MSAEDDPLTGTPYRFVRHLGEGGMGEVIEAEHISLGHRVAIKLLRSEYMLRFEIKERMRLEAQACARVRHENLVPVTDFDETADGRLFIVMERLDGRTLAEELQARTFLPVAEAIDVARQALAGLAAAHAAALVHRDVKPDNLFLCEPSAGTRRVKVLDFGIAKIMWHATGPLTPAPRALPTAEGMTVGTPRWSSPEQSRGEPDIDARSDVYSMGWVLYMMLTGRPPFAELKTGGELYAAHSEQVPPPPSAIASPPIPAALDSVVMRAIAKRREDRFPSADAFRVQLDAIVAGTVLAATVEQAPLLPRPLPGQTVATSDVAIARPVLPWAQGPESRRQRSRRELPLWFYAVIIVGVGGTVALAVAYSLFVS